MGGKKTKSDGTPSAKQRRHERNISRAAETRNSETYTVPPNAMVELASLPAKARDKIIKAIPADVHVNKNFTTGPEGHEEPIMVPDPMRGKKLKGTQLSKTIERREEQARKINKKQEQRRRFASLSPAAKSIAREAGRQQFTKR